MTRQGVITKTRAHSFFPVWVRQREQRQRLPQAHSDALFKSLYTCISPCHSWSGGETFRNEHGGLFSLEFSPDGIHLVAGSVNNCFLMFDPLSRRLIRTVHNAHANRISRVNFLDSRLLATGGDDGTVSLWDTRNLKSRFRTLQAHSSSITNIEFSRKNDLLITSALDGIIYIWDMQSGKQIEECKNSILMSHVLLCLRLNPDETKMIISTASGYFLIVHQLDLNTLAQDLVEFGLGMTEFANLHQTIFASPQNWSPLLSSNRRRNRVEIVSDFPNAGGFNVISALEIHPQGWSVFSRSKDEAREKEWTCVHDIQEELPPKGGAAPRRGSEDNDPPRLQQLERISEERCNVSGDGGKTGRLGRFNVEFCVQSGNDSGPELPDAAFSLEWGARKRRSLSPADTARSPPPGPFSAPPDPLELAGLGSNPAFSRVLDPSFPSANPSVAQFNRFSRLTHYIEEPYFSNLYVESLGVSGDGRLVCSPLDRGIRLLAFSPECSEESVYWCGTKPRRLHELSIYTSPSDSVLCAKFSPRHCLLVYSSLGGKIAWYQPVV